MFTDDTTRALDLILIGEMLAKFVECEHLWVYQIYLDMICGLKRWYMREPPNPLFPGQDKPSSMSSLIVW